MRPSRGEAYGCCQEELTYVTFLVPGEGRRHRPLPERASSQDDILHAWVAAGAAHAAEATTFLGGISLAGILASHTTGSCVPMHARVKKGRSRAGRKGKC